MIAIGAGNLIGSLFSGNLVNRMGLEKTFLFELIALITLYLILPFITTFWLAEIVLTLAFLFNGFIFPIFMTTLQSTTINARSTVSSLSNAAMYFGETFAGIIGGVLFKQFHSYLGISIFAALMILFALLVYAKSGVFKPENNNSIED